MVRFTAQHFLDEDTIKTVKTLPPSIIRHKIEECKHMIYGAARNSEPAPFYERWLPIYEAALKLIEFIKQNTKS